MKKDNNQKKFFAISIVLSLVFSAITIELAAYLVFVYSFEKAQIDFHRKFSDVLNIERQKNIENMRYYQSLNLISVKPDRQVIFRFTEFSDIFKTGKISIDNSDIGLWTPTTGKPKDHIFLAFGDSFTRGH